MKESSPDFYLEMETHLQNNSNNNDPTASSGIFAKIELPQYYSKNNDALIDLHFSAYEKFNKECTLENSSNDVFLPEFCPKNGINLLVTIRHTL